MPQIYYSVVAPFYNEEQSVKPLYDSVKSVMESIAMEYELIFINDGSFDSTRSVLDDIAKKDSRAVVIHAAYRRGQSASLGAGFDAAKGRVIISMDGDLQNDPNDIPKLIKELEKGYDFVCGWRYPRHDPLSKKIASFFGNFVQRNVFHSNLHDISCTLRAYTKGAIIGLPLKRSGSHRFIPYFLMMNGKKGSEVKVHHMERRYGRTKYGFTRSFRVAYDFLTLIFNRRSWM